MKELRLISKAAMGLRTNSKGQFLIEALIALAILGVVAVAFLTALTTASGAIIIADERTTAESLARSELEYVKSQDFSLPCPANPWSYTVSSSGRSSSNMPSWWDADNPPLLSSDYTGYSVIVTGEGYNADGEGGNDEDIWKITVKVYHSDTPNQDDLILTTSTYKVNR